MKVNFYNLLRAFLLLLILIVWNDYCSVNEISADNNTGSIKVLVEGFRNFTGKIRVNLFNRPIGFPGDSARAFRMSSQKIKSKENYIVFTDIPYGTYAVSVLHDEDQNGKATTNFYGKPKEGIGVSNNLSIGVKKISFIEASFVLKEDGKIITIKLKYL